METVRMITGLISKAGMTGDAYCEETQRQDVFVLDKKPEQIKAYTSFGAGIRVVNKGRSAFGFVTTKETEEIKKVISALGSAACVEGAENYEFSQNAEIKNVAASDPEFEAVNTEKMLSSAFEMESSALQASERVKFVRDVSVTAARVRTSYASTAGADFSHERTYYTAMLSAIAQGDKGEMETSDIYAGSGIFSGIDFKATGSKAGKTAEMLLGSRAVKTGTYALILPPMFACELLSLASKLFLGSNIARGKSLLCGRKYGDTIGSSELTIKDDALLEMHAASRGFDAEGTPSRNKVLVEKGMLRSFLHDKKSADLCGEKTTGSCVRQDFRSSPECGISNFYIDKGKCSADAVYKSASGIVVTSLMGLHMADTVSGNYSLGINGFLYENGRFVQSVRDALASGNLSDLLMNISCAADDLTFFGSVGSPTITVENITIAGK